MKKIVFLVFLFVPISIFSQSIEIPYCSDDGQIIIHTGYALKYNEQYEQAEWVAYQLTDVEVNGKYERSDNFRKDPHISTGSATLPDYKGSGYDRGHIIPAADMKWSLDAMSASFFMSNMSPQDPHSDITNCFHHLEFLTAF